jgi:hypothetical protein
LLPTDARDTLVGMSDAEYLMDRPVGGWSDLVTNHTLDLRFSAFEERFDRKLDALAANMELRFARSTPGSPMSIIDSTASSTSCSRRSTVGCALRRG